MTATKLRHLKVHLGLTTNQLARRWGINPASLRRWLNGTRPIPDTVRWFLELESANTEDLSG